MSQKYYHSTGGKLTQQAFSGASRSVLFVTDRVTMTPVECQTVKHDTEIVLPFFSNEIVSFWTIILLLFSIPKVTINFA